MAISSAEILNINLVLVGVELIKTPDEINEFRNAVGVDVVIAEAGFAIGAPIGVPVNLAGGSRILSLDKDRITIDVSAQRSTIKRDYPLSIGEIERLAEVATFAISTTESQPKAFGYNIEMVYEQDSGMPASQYLSERLFADDVPKIEDGNVLGGSGRLAFAGNGKTWRVGIEPRFNNEMDKRVFLTLNMHIDHNRFPAREEIMSSMREIEENAKSFASCLDTRGL